jgi:predicted dehydrogenase
MLTNVDRRWDSDFLTVSELIESNKLGRIAEFETHFDRHRPELATGGSWKTKPLPGGAAVYDLGTHLIDQVVQIFGIPKKITGFSGSQRESNPSGYEDSFTILMHYENNLLATVKASVVSPESKQLRFWVRGTKGSYKKVWHPSTSEPGLLALSVPSRLPRRPAESRKEAWRQRLRGRSPGKLWRFVGRERF